MIFFSYYLIKCSNIEKINKPIDISKSTFSSDGARIPLRFHQCIPLHDNFSAEFMASLHFG